MRNGFCEIAQCIEESQGENRFKWKHFKWTHFRSLMYEVAEHGMPPEASVWSGTDLGCESLGLTCDEFDTTVKTDLWVVVLAILNVSAAIADLRLPSFSSLSTVLGSTTLVSVLEDLGYSEFLESICVGACGQAELCWPQVLQERKDQ